MVNSLIGGIAGGATVAIVIKAVDEFSSVFSKVDTKMAAVGTAITAVGVAGAVALGNLAFEAGKATGRIDAFNNMMGSEAPRALQELRDATKGTVSDIDIMTQANQALLLGIDPTALPSMFKGAFAAAQATGRPVANAIADITLGIGRQSRMMLDNLGIIVKQDEANEAYALTLGKLASELTEAERKTAFINATMDALAKNEERIGTIQDSLSISTQQMGAEWDNVKQSLGESLLPIMQRLLEIIKPIISYFSEHKEVATFALAIAGVATGLSLIIGPFLIIKAGLPALIAGFSALGATLLPFSLLMAGILGIALAVFGVLQMIIRLLNLIPGINIPTAEFSDIGKGIKRVTGDIMGTNGTLNPEYAPSGLLKGEQYNAAKYQETNIYIEKVIGQDAQDTSEAMATEVKRRIHAVT